MKNITKCCQAKDVDLARSGKTSQSLCFRDHILSLEWPRCRVLPLANGGLRGLYPLLRLYVEGLSSLVS